ncbi:unnamed protein product [Closterium sp. Naga37s-1]|nr:unnamed protein product [Closterium sp. Naga37s-1]
MVRNGPITATAHRMITTVRLMMARAAQFLRRRTTVAILLRLVAVALPAAWLVMATVQRSEKEGDTFLEAMRTLYQVCLYRGKDSSPPFALRHLTSPAMFPSSADPPLVRGSPAACPPNFPTLSPPTPQPSPPNQHWESAYGLQAENTFPPSAISLPPDVPPAPHLEDCEARTAFRLSTEKWGERGEPPYWAVPNPACGNVPQPPWIRGSDAANLAATRQAQADIWRQQFPPRQCKGRRLMVVEWLSMGWHGIGSQLHVMGAVLSAALLHNRTLVLVPGTLPQADHEECEKLGHRGSLECYFFRFSSKECEAIALKAHQAWKAAEERKQQAAAEEEKKRVERERAENERAERERAEKERAGKERAEKEREEKGEKEVGEKEEREKEEGEKEEGEKEKGDKERGEKEKGEKEKEAGGGKTGKGSERRLLRAADSTGGAETDGTENASLRSIESVADDGSDGADSTDGDDGEESAGGVTNEDVTNEDVIVAQPCDNVACVASDALVIFATLPGFGVDQGSEVIAQLNATAAELWGKAYLRSPLPNEVMGRMGEHSNEFKKAHWWRAQATRFMLRWPSAYLCHIINRERHHVYGMHVARQVVASQMDQRTLLAEYGRNGRGTEERQLLASQMDQRSLVAEYGRSERGSEEEKGSEPREDGPELRRRVEPIHRLDIFLLQASAARSWNENVGIH